MARRRMYGSATSARDRRLHARLDPGLLERVLKRQRVDERREHAHVVGGRPVHAAAAPVDAAVDVAAADHDGDLYAPVADRPDLPGDVLEALGVGSVLLVAEQRLPGELYQHPPEDRLGVTPTPLRRSGRSA